MLQPVPYESAVVDLSNLLAGATSVRVVSGGHFDYKNRAGNSELLRLGAEDRTAVDALARRRPLGRFRWGYIGGHRDWPDLDV